MTPKEKTVIRRIVAQMMRWHDWWWWDIMKNYQEAMEVRAQILSWATVLKKLLK